MTNVLGERVLVITSSRTESFIFERMDLEERVRAGLEIAYERMLDVKRAKHSPVVTMKNGKIVHLKVPKKNIRTFEINDIEMAEAINQELIQYWAQLNVEQRQSILGMIKSFLSPQSDYLPPKEIPMEVQEEVIRRYENLKANPDSGISEEEMRAFLKSK